MRQSGYQTKNALLLRKSQTCLKTYQIIQAPRPVVLTQLHAGIRGMSAARIDQADRFKRAEAYGVPPSGGHDLQRHAAFKDLFFIEVVHIGGASRNQCLVKTFILCFVHRAIEIVRAAAIIAGLAKGDGAVNAVDADNRSRRVKKMHCSDIQLAADRIKQRSFRKRACRHHGQTLLRQRPYLFGCPLDQRMSVNDSGNQTGKLFPVNSKGTACRQRCRVRTGNDQ